MLTNLEQEDIPTVCVEHHLRGMQKTSDPYVQEVDTKYGFEGKRWASATGARGLCLRREEKHQLDTGDQKVYLD